MASDIVSSGIVSSGVELHCYDSMTILDGGTATDTAVNYGGTLNVASGGTATDTTVNFSGYMYVTSGGTATDTTVDGFGYMYVSSGGTATGTIVYANGFLEVFSGGSVTDTNVNTGELSIYNSGTATGTTVDYGILYVSSGGTATTTTVSRGYMFVSSGGTATTTTVNWLGNMYVSSGGTATDTTVNSSGYMYISSGGTATDTTVNWGGALYVSSGGTAADTTVNGSGTLYVSSGGTATATTVNDGGSMFISSGGVADNVTFYWGSATCESGGKMDHISLLEGYCYVSAGAVAENVFIASNCDPWRTLHVFSGGSASIAFTPWNISFYADAGAVVTELERDATIYYENLGVGALPEIFKTDFIKQITIAQHETLYIYDGGIIENCHLQKGGAMEIHSGAVINGFTVKHDSNQSDFLTLNDVTVSENARLTNDLSASGIEVLTGGKLMIGEFGSGSDVTVNSNASLFVLGGGIAEDVTVNGGGVYVATGGEIKGNISVSQSGGLYLYGGSIVDGEIHVKGTLCVDETMVSNGHITVELNEDTPGVAMIANLDYMNGLDNFTVETGNVGDGVYTLASGAADYDGTITVADDGEELGVLSVGESMEMAGTNYSLDRSDAGDLIFCAAVVVPKTRSDLDGNGISDVMFQYTGGDYQIGFWMNGTSDWQGTTASQPANWKLLGNYDMDSNGLADQVMFGNVLGGAYIGYYKDGDTTGNGWVTIGYLDNPGGIVWENAVGNLTGNAGCNSIVWQAPELGALGVWTDGTTEWVNLGGGYDSSWEMQGCGDFNGDGKDEVLFANNGNLYTIDIDGNFASLAGGVTGWEVRAIGDFSGDGQDDVVLFHSETGSVIKFENGTGYQNLGQLDKDDWFVVGAGDYNDDQQDDLLVRQYSTGMLGYYSAGDMKQWNELGRGVDMNWTVVA